MAKKNPAAVALGKRRVSGKTKEELSEAGRKAVNARWSKTKGKKIMTPKTEMLVIETPRNPAKLTAKELIDYLTPIANAFPKQLYMLFAVCDDGDRVVTIEWDDIEANDQGALVSEICKGTVETIIDQSAQASELAKRTAEGLFPKK